MAVMHDQPQGCQTGFTLAERHFHRKPYAAIVLAGSYGEAGPKGRVVAQPGDMLVHEAYDRHINGWRSSRVEVLNIPLPLGHGLPAFGQLADPDDLARSAHDENSISCERLLDLCMAKRGSLLSDWPDQLRHAIEKEPSLELGNWARAHGLSPATIGRGFYSCFGVTPKRFRLEIKARRAFAAIAQTATSLSKIAADCGFADQAHMSRAIMAYTGSTPSSLRSLRVSEHI